jgi:glyceraldehyde 3-phosphate dehydrogenase
MTATRIGINGFGRMGRLALRAAWAWPEFEFAHINELGGDAATSAHLLTFDSVHGRWDRDVRGNGDELVIEGERISHSSLASPGDVAWDEHGVEVVLECSGKFRTPELLAPYFERGVRKVVVAAPVKDERAVNIGVGVNDGCYDPNEHDIVTAASCTTNCPRAGRQSPPRGDRDLTRLDHDAA